MMDALLEHDVVVESQLTDDIPCGGTDHPLGKSGHVVASPGAFLIVAPCCGPVVVQCAPRVAAMRVRGRLHCHICGRDRDIDQYTFIPVNRG